MTTDESTVSPYIFILRNIFTNAPFRPFKLRFISIPPPHPVQLARTNMAIRDTYEALPGGGAANDQRA